MLNKGPKRILLLNPDIDWPIFNQNGRLKSEATLPALGLGYLLAVLRKRGYLVKIIDCLGEPLGRIKKEITAFAPQVVGISCFTDYRGGSLTLARLAKKIDKKIVVIFGGSHATFMFEQILTYYPEVDFCVLREGEETFPALLAEMLNSQPRYQSVLGIAFRVGKKVIKTEERPLITDLDQLPFPDREWFDLKVYHFSDPQGQDKKVASLITSRGCPFGCQFCSTSQFWGRRIRFRSIGNVIKEIDSLWKADFRVLNFLDDTFTMDENRTQELCRRLIKKNYLLPWACTTRAGLISLKTAKLMKKAGCYSVNLGIESLSPTILTNIGKGVAVSQVQETCRNLKKTGIKSSFLLMVGNLGENKKTIKETILNLKKVKPDSIFTNLTLLYPGTPLYELARKQGFINDDYWLKERRASPIYLFENSLKDLLDFEKEIWESFYWQRKDFFRWFLRKSGLGVKLWPFIGKALKLFGNED